MHDCEECGDVGLTLEHAATGAEFCTCEVGHDLMIRSHDYHETKEADH